MSDQKPINQQDNQTKSNQVTGSNNLTLDLSSFWVENKAEIISNKEVPQQTLNLDKLAFNWSNIPVTVPPVTTLPNSNFNIPQQTWPVGESILSQINKADQNVVKKNWINLENINISKYEVTNENKIILWTWWFAKLVKWQNKTINYIKILIISFIIIFLCWFLSLIFYFYNKYLDIYSQPLADSQYSSYLQTVSKYENMISNYIKIDNFSNYVWISLLSSDAPNQLNNILFATDLNFIHKKDILQNNLTSLSQDIVSTYKNMEDMKQNISEHGFYPKEIVDVLWTWEQITSIKRSLLSLETIKFLSAIKVFFYLDTFLDWISDYMKLPKEIIKQNMDYFNQRWEKDVSLYLNDCYLNPFEVDYDCNTIWDFDYYYQITKNNNSDSNSGEDQFDTSFFKKMIYYIDLKLEQTALPSFSILFQWFDPTKQAINFNIDVNTFQQDETALLKQWILNPHMLVITSLLNLFRQSTFIIWDTIDVKNLKIKPKNIMIWSTEFVVNNSFMTFALPIQKLTEREITDFNDTNN